MNPHAASNLDQLVVDEPRVLSYRPPREPFLERVARAFRAVGDTIVEYGGGAIKYADTIVKKVTHRAPGAAPTADVSPVQFVWSPSPKAPIDADAVVCIKLPARNPLALLSTYLSAGVRPERVVFVGDPLTLSDAAYDGITRMGALIHQTGKKANNERAQQELISYYATRARAREVPTENPNPYAWEPGPPRATREQLQALIDAVRARR